MYSTSDDVAKIEHYQRQCLFPDEVETFKFQKFDNLMYTEYNCVIKCIQQHMLKFCGCVVGWMIPIRKKKFFKSLLGAFQIPPFLKRYVCFE